MENFSIAIESKSNICCMRTKFSIQLRMCGQILLTSRCRSWFNQTQKTVLNDLSSNPIERWAFFVFFSFDKMLLRVRCLKITSQVSDLIILIATSLSQFECDSRVNFLNIFFLIALTLNKLEGWFYKKWKLSQNQTRFEPQ